MNTEKVTNTEKITFRPSSGNVFADFGLEDADDLMAKAELALAIRKRIDQKGLNQTQAAELMNTTQARVSELYNAKVMKMTFDRLLGFLKALDVDAYITVNEREGGSRNEQGKVVVAAPPMKRNYTTQDGSNLIIEIKGGQVLWTEKLSKHAAVHTYALDHKKALEIMQMFRHRTADFLDPTDFLGTNSIMEMPGDETLSHARLNAWDCGYIAALIQEAAEQVEDAQAVSADTRRLNIAS